MKTTEDISLYTDALKQQIEAKVAWGSSTQWTHQDFDQLSERIWEDTQTKLSATTLKRLWGKVSYSSQPATNTLNALAQFVDYEHWRDFVGQQEVQLPVTKKAPRRSTMVASWGSGRRLALAISIPLMVLGVWLFNPWTNPADTVDLSTVRFTSEPVTQGLPNTVVFQYDASSVAAGDIVIQQSWDKRLRASVDKAADTYTATYYYPGYFRAKLLADDRVIKEHDLYVKSDGWMTIAEPAQGHIPHYLPTDTTAGQLRTSTGLLDQQQILTRDEVPWINYYFVQDLGELSANNFSLETRLKNDFSQGEAVCQTSYVNVICSKGHFSLPLSIPGCVGQLTMALGKERIDGTTHDLSAFGTNLAEWQTLRCEVRNRRVTLYLNDRTIYTGAYANDVGKVVGLRYRFHGPGTVDYVRLTDGHRRVVYEEDFGEAAVSLARTDK